MTSGESEEPPAVMVGALKHVGKMMHSPNHSRIGATTQKNKQKKRRQYYMTPR